MASIGRAEHRRRRCRGPRVHGALYEILLFHGGNRHPKGAAVGGYSLTMAPPELMSSSARPACSRGYKAARPLPRTATPMPPALTVPPVSRSVDTPSETAYERPTGRGDGTSIGESEAFAVRSTPAGPHHRHPSGRR